MALYFGIVQANQGQTETREGGNSPTLLDSSQGVFQVPGPQTAQYTTEPLFSYYFSSSSAHWVTPQRGSNPQPSDHDPGTMLPPAGMRKRSRRGVEIGDFSTCYQNIPLKFYQYMFNSDLKDSCNFLSHKFQCSQLQLPCDPSLFEYFTMLTTQQQMYQQPDILDISFLYGIQNNRPFTFFRRSQLVIF